MPSLYWRQNKITAPAALEAPAGRGEGIGGGMPRKKKRRPALRKPALTVARVLAWADHHHARTGQWPIRASGSVHDDRNETWLAIDSALICGCRGLPGGISLAQLLDRERGVRNRKALPRLTEGRILAWAKAHRRRTGKWPTEDAGPIADTQGEVWGNVAAALAQGLRGLPGGDTLARLLARRLGVRNGAALPPLSVPQILSWADAFHSRSGCWPRAVSSPIAGTDGETWCAVDDALRCGLRGLPSGSSLAKLLEVQRGVRNPRHPPRLTIARILAWAEAHLRRTGRWPGHGAGPIPEAPGETWNAIALALLRGTRGLPGGESLHQLLQRLRGCERTTRR
jgi:hypothetical protein